MGLSRREFLRTLFPKDLSNWTDNRSFDENDPRITRRDFIKLLAFGVISYVLAGCGRDAVPALEPPMTIKPTLEEIIDWSFLEREIDLSPKPPDDVKKIAVPLGPEFFVPVGSIEYDEIIKYAIPRLKNGGLNPSDFSHYLIYSQFYGIPEQNHIAKNLVRYCRLAEDFLYQNLKGLDKHSIDWTVLSPDDNYTEGFNQKGFVGMFLYRIDRIKAVNAENNERNFEFSGVIGKEGSKIDIYFVNNQSIDTFYLFIGSGPTAITTPFAEILPLSVFKKSLEYEKEVGSLLAQQAGEAITESLAIVLGIKMSEEYLIPKGVELVEREAKRSDDKYRYVPLARKWIEQNGMQRAFDLYMESPAKFMRAIRAVVK